MKRWLSIGSILLLLWSTGWSVAADAFNDWLRTEKAAASQLSAPLSSAQHSAPSRVNCNGGCLALIHLLGLVSRNFAMHAQEAVRIEFGNQPEALRSIFSDPLYHPPRLALLHF